MLATERASCDAIALSSLSSSTGSRELQPPVDAKPNADAPQSLTQGLRLKVLRRFSNVTAPSAADVTSSQEQQLGQPQQQQQQQRAHGARKRLSLPFRRSSQVIASTITSVDVYYGSLTGTAARLAATLVRDIAARGVHTTLQSLEHFDAQSFTAADKRTNTRAAVFIVSTHFVGSASPSAEQFHEWLHKASTPPRSAGGKATSGGRCAATQEHMDDDATAAANATTATGVDHSSDSASTASDTGRASPSPLRLLLHWGRGKRPDAARTQLEGLQYAVFGVGNSVYLTYNAMGKFVDARLHSLGGARLCPLGLGDVASDLDAVYRSWSLALLHRLPVVPQTIRLLALECNDDALRIEPPSLSSSPPKNAERPPALVTQRSESVLRIHQYRQHPSEAPSVMRTLHARDPVLTKSTRSTAARSSRSKRVHVRFRCRTVPEPTTAARRTSGPPNPTRTGPTAVDTTVAKYSLHMHRATASLQIISLLTPSVCSDEIALVRVALLDEELNFECADTFSYLPHNSADTVARVAAALTFNLDAWIDLYIEPSRESLSGSSSSSEYAATLPFPTPCTVRTALTEFLELNSVTRELLRVVSICVANDREREALEHLASADGCAEFVQQFVKPRRGVLALLELAPSLRMSFEVFVNVVPLLKPRSYTIASSHLDHARQIELVVNLGRADHEQHGLSVTYLRRVVAQQQRRGPSSGVMLRACITRSAFKAPADVTAPMILIASGVGIAPMRALLAHRKREAEKCTASQSAPAQSLLVYGCDDAASMLFEDELHALEREGFVALYCAFDDAGARTTVHGVVAQRLHEIVEMTCAHSNAIVCVCGAATMVRRVQRVLQSYIPPAATAESGKSSSSSGRSGGRASWFDELVASRRFVCDAFG